jgi:integrase/recombinase XerD
MHVDLDQPVPIVLEVAGILRDGRGENVNKSQRAYRFAVGEDVRRYLELMIQDRTMRGEPLQPDSWLFRSYSKRHGDKNVRKVKLSEPGLPLSVAQVGKIVRKAAEDRGIQRKFGKRYLFHPHGFRRYWKPQLRMGGVDSDLLDYMMGHALPYGGAYDRWTGEDLRGQYRRAEDYVCLRPVYTVSKEEVRTEVFKVLLGNVSREDVEKLSENLGPTPAQIFSLLNRFGEEEK